MRVAQVVGESAEQSRLDVAGVTGLTPLVGREAEVTLLRERWAQSTEGLGQVVLLSGEAGIGKSRLVHVLTERVVDKGAPRLTLRCSPYHTNSAFYPVIDHLQRLTQGHCDASPEARLALLEQALQTAGLPLGEAVPLLAALLSLPVPEQLSTADPESPASEAEDARGAGRLAAARDGAAARPGGVGRPALGRSVHPGAARAAPGPGPHRAPPPGPDLPAGVSAALDPTLLRNPAYPLPPDTPTG